MKNENNSHTYRKLTAALCVSIITMTAMPIAPVFAQEASPNEVIQTVDENGHQTEIAVDQNKSENEIRQDIIEYIKEENKNVTAVSITGSIDVKEGESSAETIPYDEAIEKIAEEYLVTIESTEKKRVVALYTRKTQHVRSAKVRKTVEQVIPGKAGKKETETTIVRKNGTVQTSSQKTKIIKKARPKKIIKGTGTFRAKKGEIQKGTSGEEILKYAKKFLGNPYVWGGTSLTHGCDCTGFVYSIYRHFGVATPRIAMSSVGKRVSLKNLKPGDVLIYTGHVAIYAGNGKAIHALNRRKGICITSTNIRKKPKRAYRYVTK